MNVKCSGGSVWAHCKELAIVVERDHPHIGYCKKHKRWSKHRELIPVVDVVARKED